jgi:hypothetical protein
MQSHKINSFCILILSFKKQTIKMIHELLIGGGLFFWLLFFILFQTTQKQYYAIPENSYSILTYLEIFILTLTFILKCSDSHYPYDYRDLIIDAIFLILSTVIFTFSVMDKLTRSNFYDEVEMSSKRILVFFWLVEVTLFMLFLSSSESLVFEFLGFRVFNVCLIEASFVVLEIAKCCAIFHIDSIRVPTAVMLFAGSALWTGDFIWRYFSIEPLLVETYFGKMCLCGFGIVQAVMMMKCALFPSQVFL